MFQDLNIFRMSHALAVHAGRRQALLSQNMANVDTPGYRARDLTPFAEAMAHDTRAEAGTMKATRVGHTGQGIGIRRGAEIEAATERSPNGNGVSIEIEMLKAVEVQRQHSRALAIYKSSLNILRTSLGR